MTRPAFAARARARLAPVAVGLAVLVLLVVRPLGGGSVVRATGELPACRYDDVLTTPRGYGDWSVTLVDTILRVTKSYVPPDLVSVTEAGLGGKSKTIRAVAVDDLRQMADAARAAGAPIGVQSAYRSYAEQKAVFDGWVSRLGYTDALKVSARPGHSEHQLGLAIDFRSDPATPLTLHSDWDQTPAGQWMAEHAWEYGWVMSYPKGASSRTCYAYEPWHFRYVGREIAATIHQAALTSREYLWANFTTTVVPPPGRATAAPPSATTAPIPSTTPTPEPSPTAIAVASPTTAATAVASPPPAATAGPTARPVEGAPAVDAGQAVVAGALATLLASIAVVALAMRRGRPPAGGPPR
jgi:LAS superfamily LD-carboxypeptidase LdcB